MSTRSAGKNLIPISDPDAIIRAANAAKRKAKIDAALANHSNAPKTYRFPPNPNELPALPPSPIMSDPLANPVNLPKEPPQSSTSAPGSSPRAELPLQDYLKGVIELQHRSIDQAILDRHALNEYHKANEARRQEDADRIARLEESVILLSVKQEPVETSARPAPGRIDLQRFRPDGPLYTGPPQMVEPFITWIQGVELLFTTSGFTHDDDKIRVVGKLIREGNTQSFYAREINSLLGKTWANFKSKLMAFALPPLWRSKLREQFRNLKMLGSESFLEYNTRCRTLQNHLNLETNSISDFDLAESMTSGMGDLLRTDVNNHQLLLQNPFDYTTFESRASVFWDGIVLKRTAARTRVNPTSTQSSAQLPLRSKEENIWRVHAYLDSEGLCRFCKKKCGSAPGTCSGHMDRKFVPIPDTFVAPPMPPGWKPPINRASAPSTAGKPTRPPAGRAATVAGVSSEDTEQNLDQASLSAISALDEELRLAIADQFGGGLDYTIDG
ncbi:hypothetical protein Pst134EB_033516 [Puccinia striiformis f. sp. tritici]|nr:hypothetical protein Pst134EB_033516 [Puccinia striiformis f. sp. tritici]